LYLTLIFKIVIIVAL